MNKMIMSFTKSNEWMNKSLNSSTRSVGWGNGYCAPPSSHPCYKMPYSEIYEAYPDVSFPAELTFTCLNSNKEKGSKLFTRIKGTKDCWIVGFDTMHLGDNLNSWPRKRVIEESRKLAFAFYEILLIEGRKKNNDKEKQNNSEKSSGEKENSTTKAI